MPGCPCGCPGGDKPTCLKQRLHTVMTDGCKCQYKNRWTPWHISQQFSNGLLRKEWCFNASGHGKCMCDSEGGVLKSLADRHVQRTGSSSAKVTSLYCAFDLYEFLREKAATPTQSFEQKVTTGIHSRHFEFIPLRGVGAIDRCRLPSPDRLAPCTGISTFHQIIDCPCEVGSTWCRVGSCHSCKACRSGSPLRCINPHCGAWTKITQRCAQHQAAPITRAATTEQGSALGNACEVDEIIAVLDGRPDANIAFGIARVTRVGFAYHGDTETRCAVSDELIEDGLMLSR